MTVVHHLIENILMLGFMGVGFYVVQKNDRWLAPTMVSVLHGFAFGLVAFLVTSTPVTLIDGATVDARAGPVLLAGVVAGPVGGLIAATLGALARWLVGGNFAPSGVVVYFLYAGIGVLLYLFKLVTLPRLSRPRAIALLVVASCICASAMFFLIEPQDRAIQWLREDLPYIFLANALSVVCGVFLISLAFDFLEKEKEGVYANERLSLAKTAGGFGVWDFDVATGKLLWDEKSKELHGIPGAGFQGTFEDWARNVHPDDLGPTQDKFVEALAAGTVFDTEYRVRLPDGRVNTVKGDAVIVRDSNGKASRVVGTNIDLTEIRTTEVRLAEARALAVQAQKFETIGQMTGGVAHDFNNLLAVIMGNLELLADEVDAPVIDRKEMHTLIDASIEATKRGAGLTQNMLAYARKARLSPVLVDLNEIVRETETWMRRTIESRIVIETVLQAGLWPTLADRSSLQSALVNLLVNARDAIDGSGKVTIETSNVRVDEEYINERDEDISAGRYVMLAVTDSGKGIPPDVFERIFDPFFTTKDVGKGSGLGLSMVQGFVKQSGGTVRVYSEPGTGTCFKLYFAVAPEAARESVQPEPEQRHADFAAAESRILLVEDREEVILVLQKTLEGAGYEVVPARNGDEGLTTFQKQNPFDLVITDIVMPGDLQGPSMARSIREIAPDMKFIFLSGYASEATVHGNGLRPDDIRLMKPISRNALLDAVRKCLATPEPKG
jgi:signal transduction histidine kinase/CheY-like chemotaxis protein